MATVKLKNVPIGDKVLFGEWAAEPLTWTVVAKDHAGYPDDSVTLFCDKVLVTFTYDCLYPNSSLDMPSYKDTAFNYWLSSDARNYEWVPDEYKTYNDQYAKQYFPGKGFLASFSDAEKNAVLTTQIADFCVGAFLPDATELGCPNNPKSGGLAFENLPSSLVFNVGTSWIYRNSHPLGLYGNEGVGYVQCVPNGPSVYAAFRRGNVPYGMRPLINLSVDAEFVRGDDGVYTIVDNTPPSTPGTPTINADGALTKGRSYTVSWNASTDTDGAVSSYRLEQSINGAAHTTVYNGANTSAEITISNDTNSIKFRVSAFDDAGAQSDYAESASYATQKCCSPPVITWTGDTELSNLRQPPHIEFRIKGADEDEGEVITITTNIDGRFFPWTFDQPIDLTDRPNGSLCWRDLSIDDWITLTNGEHKAICEASIGNSETRVLEVPFTKLVTDLAFETNPINAGYTRPKRVQLNITKQKPPGATIQVWVCNNAYDESPTWEECSEKALAGKIITFANTAKTDSAWAIGIKVSASRGTASTPLYISEISGAWDT